MPTRWQAGISREFPVGPDIPSDLEFLPNHITFGKCCSRNRVWFPEKLRLRGSTFQSRTFLDNRANSLMSGFKFPAHVRQR